MHNLHNCPRVSATCSSSRCPPRDGTIKLFELIGLANCCVIGPWSCAPVLVTFHVPGDTGLVELLNSGIQYNPGNPCIVRTYADQLTPEVNHPWPFLGLARPVPWMVWNPDLPGVTCWGGVGFYIQSDVAPRLPPSTPTWNCWSTLGAHRPPRPAAGDAAQCDAAVDAPSLARGIGSTWGGSSRRCIWRYMSLE